MDDGRKVVVGANSNGCIEGKLPGIFVQVGGSWREVAVWVGRTNLSGMGGGGNGLRPDCGFMRTIRKNNPKRNARNKNNPEKISKIDFFMVLL